MKPLKLLYTTLLILGIGSTLFSQNLVSRTAHINVSSENKLKKIEADNHQVFSSVNLETGVVKFEGLLKSFEFKLGAADRVFNSDKVKVNKYPKIKYEGTIPPTNIDLNKYQEVQVEVDGTLYIWDEKRRTKATATITSVGDGKQVFAYSSFVMTIEEQSMNKLNEIMKSKLPDVLNISTETLGVSRDIIVNLDATYKVR